MAKGDYSVRYDPDRLRRMIERGDTAKEIMRAFKISPYTLREHLTMLQEKDRKIYIIKGLFDHPEAEHRGPIKKEGIVFSKDNIPVSLFVFLENFPISTVTSILAILVVISFFVTSSDSGSMVIDIITAGGNADPPKPQRLFWAVSEGAVAAVLLLGGGLLALQTAAIATGLPFAVVVLMMCWAVLKGLRNYVQKHGYGEDWT